MNLSVKELVIQKINNNEKEMHNCKYVFIDNKSEITNIIFTGAGQKYYMMMSWFNEDKNHNYLYLNTLYLDYSDITIYSKIIESCNSKFYNMLGVSYGGYAAIVYATLFPTRAVIVIDPARLAWNIHLEPYILKLNSMLFYHRSSHIHDILEYMQIRNALEKTKLWYMMRCSQIEVHSSNIPNENMILEYIEHAKNMLDDKCQILMKETTMQELFLEFLPWT